MDLEKEKINEMAGPVWPPGYLYVLVDGAGDHTDCMSCAFYSLPNCGQINGGCGQRGFWRVKEEI